MLSIVTIDNGSGNWPAQNLIEESRRVTQALDQTAEKAVQEIRADMPQRFTLRNSWIQKGIRFDRASTKNLEAWVYSIDPYMRKQEFGEHYEADGHVAIPSAARPTRGSLIPRRMLPNALRARKDVFRFDFSKKSSYKPYPLNGLFQRVGQGKFIKVLYLLKDQKDTRPVWDFDGQVDAAVSRYFKKSYAESPGDSR